MTNHKYSLDKGRCQYQSGTALISDSPDGIRRNESFFSVVPPEMTQNPMNICSDFHLGRHFFGLVGVFFVRLSVTLWLGMTLGGGYSMT